LALSLAESAMISSTAAATQPWKAPSGLSLRIYRPRAPRKVAASAVIFLVALRRSTGLARSLMPHARDPNPDCGFGVIPMS
jgi:hypothetical protein